MHIGAGEEETAIKKKGRSLTVSVAPAAYVEPQNFRQRGGSVSRQRPASALYEDLGFQDQSDSSKTR